MVSKEKESTSVFCSNRGMSHDLFFNIFELVLASIILLALLYFINDISEQTIFEKNFMARDLALLINTIYAAPGEVKYNYNENMEGFIFDFSDSKVEIKRKQDDESANVFYPFAKTKNIPFSDKRLNYEKEIVKIIFSKSADSVDITKPSTINTDIASSQQSKPRAKDS
ncbi:hypothetical protein HY636_01230 [Candidatus Woesearchaeota archaeon]|nr:hypothetical protein [Candidatus Woesearchaeota archaeon]